MEYRNNMNRPQKSMMNLAKYISWIFCHEAPLLIFDIIKFLRQHFIKYITELIVSQFRYKICIFIMLDGKNSKIIFNDVQVLPTL